MEIRYKISWRMGGGVSAEKIRAVETIIKNYRVEMREEIVTRLLDDDCGLLRVLGLIAIRMAHAPLSYQILKELAETLLSRYTKPHLFSANRETLTEAFVVLVRFVKRCDEYLMTPAHIQRSILLCACLAAAAFQSGLSRKAHLDLLEAAFAMCYKFVVCPPAGLKQRAARNANAAAMTMREHAIAMCTTAIALFYAISRHTSTDICTSAVGTHRVEKHFGDMRLRLRGRTDWLAWKGAEVWALMTERIRRRLGLPEHRRRGRTKIDGTVIRPEESGDEVPGVSCTTEQLIAHALEFYDGDSLAQGFFWDDIALILEGVREMEEPTQGSLSGLASNARRFMIEG
jgi:hypothetical protein